MDTPEWRLTAELGPCQNADASHGDEIDTANEAFTQFAADFRAGHLPVLSIGELWTHSMTLWKSSAYWPEQTPEVVTELESEDGVVYSQLVEMIRPFLQDINRSISVRAIRRATARP